MSKASAAFGIALMACFIAGCGNNASNNEQPTPVALATSNGSTLESEPTAVLDPADEATANSLAAEFDQGMQELAQVGQVAGAQGQAQTSSANDRFVTTQSTPGTHVVTMATRALTYTCAQFLGSGASGTISYTYPDTPPTTGWQSSLAFKDCSYSFGVRAYTVNGTIVYEYVRYVSGSDFGFVGRTQDLVLSTSLNGQPVSAVRYTLSYAFDIHNGVIVTSYATPSSVFKDLKVVATGTQLVVNLSAVVDMKERRGAVKIKLTDWRYDLSVGHAVGGTAVVTGANGTRAVVVPSTTGYTVTYTDNTGKTKVYSYTYPTPPA